MEIASQHKVAYHKDKLDAYLAGRSVFPATLELDITSSCTRDCPDCPSSRSARSYQLSMSYLDSLFGFLEGETRGLLLTGGEPTTSPLFGETLAAARRRGFREIAVVTNGSCLHEERIGAALLEHATTLRISMYDWNDRDSRCDIGVLLDRIESLRSRTDRAGGALRIGVSVLTDSDNARALPRVTETVRASGAHWVYFHPRCSNWYSGRPRQVDQRGVMEVVESIRSSLNGAEGFEAFFSRKRYARDPLRFSAYHAAHFLLVIGADGLNYLAPEVKYQPRHVIADAARGRIDRFLWDPKRLAAIHSVKSAAYPALFSRHRGELYSDFIERLLGGRPEPEDREVLEASVGFLFPHIL